jgi:hypothetical protein
MIFTNHENILELIENVIPIFLILVIGDFFQGVASG